MGRMFGTASGGLVAVLDRPSTAWLVVACSAVLAGWAHHRWSERALLPPDPTDDLTAPDSRPGPLEGHELETPAIVGLLTNRFRVPNSAITATALDLAGRGWVRLAVVDDELVVVTRGTGAAGDELRPYEQQVLNHLASRAFNDVVSAGTLLLAQHRLDRAWRRRFASEVARHAHQLGLSRRRFTLAAVVPGAIAVAAAVVSLTVSVTSGTDAPLADSWRPRAVVLIALVATIGLAARTYERFAGSEQSPTPAGDSRAAVWMGYRRRLRQRIPGNASVLGQHAQQRALAHASVMGVAEQVLDQLPVAPEDSLWAWSEAGERAHVVAVRYPIRPGYGQPPLRVAASGALVLIVARFAQQFLAGVADGTRLRSVLDRVPSQVDLISNLATVCSVVCWLPIAWGAWSLVAGLVDSVATRERIGLVVRTRRPSDVQRFARFINPFVDQDRFSTFLAVDDARSGTVSAWIANERTSAPQGAQARVRATPLLGYVRSSEPVGTASRPSG